MKDLIVAVADSDQEKIMEALLPRLQVSSGTRSFNFDILKNPEKDSGSFNISHELLRPLINQYSFALVIFDYEGCGVEEQQTVAQVEAHVESLLGANGWNQRNAVAVVNPEIENWVWLDNPHVHTAINWNNQQSLYDWARQSGKINQGAHKPQRPKEAFLDALYVCDTPKSSAIYKQIATRVSYKNCTDPAFNKVISTLKGWFP
jgi:hypothetical protein